VALVFSVMGVMADQRKTYAIVMLLVSGAVTLLLSWFFLAH
jgi:hypothetical protein